MTTPDKVHAVHQQSRSLVSTALDEEAEDNRVPRAADRTETGRRAPIDGHRRLIVDAVTATVRTSRQSRRVQLTVLPVIYVISVIIGRSAVNRPQIRRATYANCDLKNRYWH